MESSIPIVLDFWFGGDLQHNYHYKWFPDGNSDIQANTDREIVEKFQSVFDSAISQQLNDWQESLRGAIALIIVLDQFSRHIYRYHKLPPDHELRKSADSLALSVAIYVQDHYNEELQDLPAAHFVFTLMPFRHNANVDRLEYVMNKLDVRQQNNLQTNELLQRFRKQTYRRLQHLQDRVRVSNVHMI
jgi:uncharacterized protein (DUF924 family)